jgi:hypothetical protein
MWRRSARPGLCESSLDIARCCTPQERPVPGRSFGSAQVRRGWPAEWAAERGISARTPAGSPASWKDLRDGHVGSRGMPGAGVATSPGHAGHAPALAPPPGDQKTCSGCPGSCRTRSATVAARLPASGAQTGSDGTARGRDDPNNSPIDGPAHTVPAERAAAVRRGARPPAVAVAVDFCRCLSCCCG